MVDNQRLLKTAKTIKDYKRLSNLIKILSKNIKDYQIFSKTYKDYQIISKTFEDFAK